MASQNSGRSEDFFQTLAEEAIMGIVTFELPVKKCIYINQLAREILEIDLEIDCAAIKFEDLIPEKATGNLRAFSEELCSLEGLVRDVLMRKKTDIPFVADLGIKHIEEKNTDQLLLMFQDVSIQKKLQRELTTKQQEIKNAYVELLEQNKQLKELDLAKDRFMALTTHELRTPLAAIVATAEVLDMKLYDTDEQRDEFISTVHEQGVALMNLVNDILDFTKIQAGKMEFFIEELEIFDLLELQITNFEHMAEKYKVELICKRPDEPRLCYIDKIRIGEVLSNVISNAIKFCREGKKVEITIQENEQIVTIAIADQGQGIKAENIDKVFNEFETVGNISRHHKGTGLGMPISKKIMDQLGGNIRLQSKFGEGTTFFIEIPKHKVLDLELYRTRPDELDDLLSTV